MKQPEFIIMCGLPASGKNHWISKFQKTKKYNHVVVELDEIRSEIFGHNFHRPAEPFVIGMAKSFTKLLLKQGKNVIVNSTALTNGIRLDWIHIAKDYTENIKIVWVNTPFGKCVFQNQTRIPIKQVPQSVIEDMNNIFSPPSSNDFILPFHVQIVEIKS
jgi:predicted kinase